MSHNSSHNRATAAFVAPFVLFVGMARAAFDELWDLAANFRVLRAFRRAVREGRL